MDFGTWLSAETRADELLFSSRVLRAPLITPSIFTVFHCRRNESKSGREETAPLARMENAEENLLLRDV